MKTLLRRLLPCLLLLIAGMVCAPASAASCSVSSNGLAFGNYDPVSATTTSGTGFISLTCTPACLLLVCEQVNATVSLNAGSSGSYALRTMKQGTAQLGYNLYTTISAATVFGNGTGGSSVVTYCVPALLLPCLNATYIGSPGQPFSIPVYGQIVAQQDVISGAYVDPLTITVTF